MSSGDDIIYDYPPMFDEYEDEDWYLWFGCDDCPYSKKIKEEDHMPTQILHKNPFRFDHVCAVAGKHASRIRSPLDRRNFWICDSGLIDARSDRWDFRSEYYTGSYLSPKLLQFINFIVSFVKIMSEVTPTHMNMISWLVGKFKYKDEDWYYWMTDSVKCGPTGDVFDNWNINCLGSKICVMNMDDKNLVLKVPIMLEGGNCVPIRDLKVIEVMLGVDRLDMIKSIQQNVLASENFLKENLDLHDQVILLHIVVQTRNDVLKYQKLTCQVHEIIGRINGRCKGLTTVLIHNLVPSLDFHGLCSLYAFNDVALITSLKNGEKMCRTFGSNSFTKLFLMHQPSDTPFKLYGGLRKVTSNQDYVGFKIVNMKRSDIPFSPGGLIRSKTRGQVLLKDGENDAVAFRLELDWTRYPHEII